MQLMGASEPSADPSASRWLDPRQGFFEMGMDSLMAIELKKQLEAALGYVLPVTLAFKYPSIEAITTYLLHEVLPAPQSAAVA